MVHIVIGTRAQLIKMLPLMKMMREKSIAYNFVLLAQHRDTIYEILDDFGLRHPDYVLCDDGTDVVRTSQMIYWSLRVLIKGFVYRKKIFKSDRNGIVLVHGDAPPVLLGALLAKVQGLSVGIVEAGLRSYDLWRPFPEEITRVLVGKTGLADRFYCQDAEAMKSVDCYRGKAIYTNGNTIIDTIRLAAITENGGGATKTLFSGEKRYAVVSLHRFESISNAKRLSLLMDLVIMASQKISLKFILHPPTKEALLRSNLYGMLDDNPAITLLPRMSFLSFSNLISRAEFIMTDGGSNQEESAYLGIPCILMRTETERRDGIGKNVLLSKLDPLVVEEFLNNYGSYRFAIQKSIVSPSATILESIVCEGW